MNATALFLATTTASAVGRLSHSSNWWAGWSLILAAFLTGAVIGLGSHRETYLGGYATYRRRMTRLGHIALAALGMLNVLFGLSPLAPSTPASVASIAWIVGAIAMPAVCFLAAWREPLRQLFFIPVAALLTAVVTTLIGGCL